MNISVRTNRSMDSSPHTRYNLGTVQFLKQANQVSGAIVVTTPEEASLADVRKELNFCQKTNLPILGLIENMGTLETTFEKLQFKSTTTGEDCSLAVLEMIRQKCPEILEDFVIHTSVFAGTGAQQMALEYQCPFWGQLPLDPSLLQATDTGSCYSTICPTATAALRLQEFCQRLLQACPLPVDETTAASS